MAANFDTSNAHYKLHDVGCWNHYYIMGWQFRMLQLLMLWSITSGLPDGVNYALEYNNFFRNKGYDSEVVNNTRVYDHRVGNFYRCDRREALLQDV